jgi:ABC-type nitrate/sulfonate/bicarbonate transport system substrate-binding protein
LRARSRPAADPSGLAALALDRRRFLQRSLQAGGLVALGAPLLAACGSGSGSSAAAAGATGGAKSFGTVDFRFSWIKNVEFAGSYIADQKGYYKAEGFSGANFIAGGPSAIAMETDVANGKAFVAVSSPDITGSAVLKGAPLRIIGAQYQKSPFAVMSMAGKPIATPQDMYGKRIGVQATNESVWNAYVKAAKLDASKITKVPVQFDPLPLTQGAVDGWFSFITNEPNELKTKGFDTHTFLLADTGYPLVSEVYITTTDSITNNREKLKAFLRAEIHGWKDNAADPALGAGYTVDIYGKGLGLDRAEQTLESTSENALINTPDTAAHGLFTITDGMLSETIGSLKIAGVDLTAGQLFDLSLLKEVYAEQPSLV